MVVSRCNRSADNVAMQLYDQNKSEVEEILGSEVARKHEGSALFQWMRGTSEMLHQRNPTEGISILNKVSQSSG